MTAIFSSLNTGTDYAVVITVLLLIAVQTINVFLTFSFRSEIKTDFREVFDELRSNNRALGKLEGMESRLKAVEDRIADLQHAYRKDHS